jgi:hypothetical protein
MALHAFNIDCIQLADNHRHVDYGLCRNVFDCGASDVQDVDDVGAKDLRPALPQTERPTLSVRNQPDLIPLDAEQKITPFS